MTSVTAQVREAADRIAAALGAGGSASPVPGAFRLHHPDIAPGPLRPETENAA